MVRITRSMVRRGDIYFRTLGDMVNRDVDVSAGIHPAKGKQKKLNYYRRRQSESLATVARKHEYGDRRIPARSFLRGSFRENKKKYNSMAVSAMRVLAMRRATVSAVRTAMHVVGKEMVKDIQANISKFIPPSLALRTMKAKQRAGLSLTPLIATKQLFNAIGYKVKIGKLL